MTDVLDKLDQLAEQATARPWPDWREEKICAASLQVIASLPQADAAFIVALVNAYPALAARLRAAEAVCEKLRRHFGPEYATSNWEIRNDTRAALEAWRLLRDAGGDNAKG